LNTFSSISGQSVSEFLYGFFGAAEASEVVEDEAKLADGEDPEHCRYILVEMCQCSRNFESCADFKALLHFFFGQVLISKLIFLRYVEKFPSIFHGPWKS
jgi:hypothetical protein